MTNLTSVERTILDHFHAPDDRHGSWWINPGEMAAAVETQVREQIAKEIEHYRAHLVLGTARYPNRGRDLAIQEVVAMIRRQRGN